MRITCEIQRQLIKIEIRGLEAKCVLLGEADYNKLEQDSIYNLPVILIKGLTDILIGVEA